jgi:hypothetical protein
MSGQQIGSTIGLVVGSYFGGPVGGAIGSAIGGYLGGVIDPTIVKGPKIGDGQTQSSTDGQAIAWVQGTGCVAGTIVQVSTRRQIRHKEGGKGSGTVQETFTAQQDFAILICESCVSRDSVMSQVLMVYQDGKLVYDVRPGSAIAADSAKWVANVDFLFGGEDQLPHPTLEAISGVGNTPAYRGSLVAVFKNFDVTSVGDRIPQFQFVVASAGSPPISVLYTDNFKYRVENTATPDYSSPTYDDSSWLTAPGGFGGSSIIPQIANTYVPTGLPGRSIWLRKELPAVAASGVLTVQTITDDGAWLWVAGTNLQNGLMLGGTATIDLATVSPPLVVVLKAVDCVPSGSPTGIFAGMNISKPGADVGQVPLSLILSRISLRGGLAASDFDLSHVPDIMVAGYVVATQSNAADTILPLLQAYFMFGSEYDAQLHYHAYGDDSTVNLTIDSLMERDNSNDGLVTSTLRNQETEFPSRIVVSYFDTAQNYKVVNVTSRRTASTIKAIGDQSFQVPVAMDSQTAIQVADKAMKIAYASLQGTLELTVPYADDAGVYLSLPTGFPLTYGGKRYVIDQATISQGTIDFKLRYDRQSAYTSTVQAIPGNAPAVPTSPYSGPTSIMALNLPSLRPQDSYGIYIAASSTTGSPNWRGCAVDISYDAQASWQPAVSVTYPSVMGTVAVAQTALNGNFKVQVNGDLTSATTAQLAAGSNGFAVMNSSGVCDLGQFKNATEDLVTAGLYLLDTVTQGLRGTTGSIHTVGQAFTNLDGVYFLPIPVDFKGKTLYLRATGFGEDVSAATIISFVYTPDTTIIYDAGTVTT